MRWYYSLFGWASNVEAIPPTLVPSGRPDLTYRFDSGNTTRLQDLENSFSRSLQYVTVGRKKTLMEELLELLRKERRERVEKEKEKEDTGK